MAQQDYHSCFIIKVIPVEPHCMSIYLYIQYHREFESPHGWDIWENQTTYTSLHMWTLCITWLVALGLGIAAAMMMEHNPTRRPGCSIPVNPFVNPHSQTVTDPGFNFVLSFVILGRCSALSRDSPLFGSLYSQILVNLTSMTSALEGFT